MKKIKIERGIKPPAPKERSILEALKKLKVGDSFAAPMTDGQAAGTYVQARRLGITIRRGPDEKSKGRKTRVWRIT